MADITALVGSDTLRDFVLHQRWFRSKARRVSSLQVVDSVSAVAGTVIAVVAVEFEDGPAEMYLLPLAMQETLTDGVSHDGLCRSLLALATCGGQVRTAHGLLRGESLVPIGDLAALDMPIKRTGADQSNTSVIFGSSLILKLFRRLEYGINPDVEVSAFLTARHFANVPATVGTIEYVRDGVEPASAVMVQRFVPNRGNGWQAMLSQLERGLADESSMADALRLPRLLGTRTGELHVTLASGEDDAFAPEVYSASELEHEAQRMRDDVDQLLELLERSRRTLAPELRADADGLAKRRDAIVGVYDDLVSLAGRAWRIRCHGDYHLGQTLVTDNDVVILDFEGEPARSLGERRAKASPIRDVSGMLRSFTYVAAAAKDRGARRAHDWEAAAVAAFVQAYRETGKGERTIPSDDTFDVLLRAYTMDKAVYELGYELNNRPDWVAIPLNGISSLIDSREAATDVDEHHH